MVVFHQKPTVAHAKVVHMIRHSEKYGVKVSRFFVDLKKIKERKDSIKLEMRTSLKEWMVSLENCTVIEGHAKFESPHVVRVNNRLLRADRFFSMWAVEHKYSTFQALIRSPILPT